MSSFQSFAVIVNNIAFSYEAMQDIIQATVDNSALNFDDNFQTLCNGTLAGMY